MLPRHHRDGIGNGAEATVGLDRSKGTLTAPDLLRTETGRLLPSRDAGQVPRPVAKAWQQSQATPLRRAVEINDLLSKLDEHTDHLWFVCLYPA